MIPLCLILGDSIAVGTSAALAISGFQCETRAQIGASSSDAVRSAAKSLSASLVVIAIGSNDPRNPELLQNLEAIRRRTASRRVVWVAPYNPAASAIVRTVAVTFGDTVLQLNRFRTRDGIHPVSYRAIARMVGLARPTLRLMGEQPAAPGAQRAVRQAAVITF